MKNIKMTPYVPNQISVHEDGENRIKINVYPFELGYAITLAHPIRRLLLTSISGYSPIGVKIEGASHEFDSVKNIMEDVAIFIINLKKMRFKIKDDTKNELEVNYSFKGYKEVEGKDLVNDEVEIFTEDLHLATVDEGSNLNFSILLRKGIGYVASEELRDLLPEDYIAIDGYFSPVKKAIYDIENVFVEDDPTFEKIVLTIETDGSVAPLDAFKTALMTMEQQMEILNKELDITPESVLVDVKEVKKELVPNILLQKIDALNLSVRGNNCLTKSNIKYIGEITLMSETEIRNIQNLGNKSVEEIKDKLAEIGYPVGGVLEKDFVEELVEKIKHLKEQ